MRLSPIGKIIAEGVITVVGAVATAAGLYGIENTTVDALDEMKSKKNSVEESSEVKEAE